MAFAASAHAAAPRIIEFSGQPLAKPVRLTDWIENSTLSTLFRGAPPAAPRAERRRPFLKVSLYWGVTFTAQHGRFYPARPGRPALIDLPWAGAWPRLVPPSALHILRRHRVPTGVSPPDGGTLLVKPG